MNAQWLGDILLGNLEALRQIQYGRYTTFSLQDPFAPAPHLVSNLLGKRGRSMLPPACVLSTGLGFGPLIILIAFPVSSPPCLPLRAAQECLLVCILVCFF